MSAKAGSERPGPTGSGDFKTTHWSIVLAAGRRSSPHSREALSELCRKYWYPLYVYVRRQAHDVHAAQDLTQEFFATLLEKNYVAAAEPERGKFRDFLLASLKHFLAKERDRARAHKRGGGRPVVSLNFDLAEDRYHVEPAHDLTPERLYERRWALTLLEQVLERLQEESAAGGKGRQFDRLKEFLTGEKRTCSYAQVAEELGMSEGAVKVAVHRLRRRYRKLLKEEIAQTVAGPDELNDELRNLLLAVRSEKC